MNASVFQRDIKRLINQSMSVKEVLSTKRFRDDDNLEMVHRSSPIRDRHLGIRHRSSDEIRQHLRRDHPASSRPVAEYRRKFRKRNSLLCPCLPLLPARGISWYSVRIGFDQPPFEKSATISLLLVRSQLDKKPNAPDEQQRPAARDERWSSRLLREANSGVEEVINERGS